MKNTKKIINRLDDAEEYIRNMREKVMEVNQNSKKK